jgi:hypothetical protein
MRRYGGVAVMRRRALLASISLAAAVATAQPSRESYRAAFQAWRNTAPSLEQDAAAPPPEFAAQLEAAAEAAQTFLSARADYLAAGQGATAEQFQWASRGLASVDGVFAVPADATQLLNRTSDYLRNTVNNFSAVRDPAIQQVRQAMERERAALVALTETLRTRASALQELVLATDAAEQARGPVAQALANLRAGRDQLAEHVRREAAGWSRYYRDLAEGAAAPIRAAPGTLISSVAPAPVKAAPARPAGALPASRYTGAWTFPTKGLFHGPEPERVELVVEEDNGRLSGSFQGRFRLPPDSHAHPELRLRFQGLMLDSRTQSFPIETEDGASGTIELIPGPAFNLLEVNIQTDAAPNRIRAVNVVLLKR